MFYNVGGIVLKDKSLLVVRKKNDRVECILTGGKKEAGANDIDTLKREFLEELGVSIIDVSFLGSYEDKAIFSDDLFHMQAYLVEIDGTIKSDHEIKEFLWIDKNYKEKGILVSNMLENNIIPKLIKKGLM